MLHKILPGADVRVGGRAAGSEGPAATFGRTLSKPIRDAQPALPGTPGCISRPLAEAFHRSKANAALQQAGRAVIGVTAGRRATRAVIWEEGGGWEGEVFCSPPVPETAINRTGWDWQGYRKADACEVQDVRVRLSGLTAVRLFGSDIRVGAGLYELDQAKCLTNAIANRLRYETTGVGRTQNADGLFGEITCGVERDLLDHEPVVRAIADEVFRKDTIDTPELRRLLEPIFA